MERAPWHAKRWRIAVCGGGQVGREAVFRALDAAHARKPIEVLSVAVGCEAGALALEWAAERRLAREVMGMPVTPMHERHSMMLHEAGGVIALPGGSSEEVVRLAVAAGLPVWRPYG